MAAGASGTADPIVTRLVKEDKVPWYKKPNLRVLYLLLFCCCMGVEMTSGFDSQLINALQLTSTWVKYFSNGYTKKDSTGKMVAAIYPPMLGFLSSSYQLGSIFGVPVAPYLNQKYGRRFSIMSGSLIMVVGALIQGFSQNVGMYIVARIILGFGIVFCIISGSAMIGELGHPKERAVLTSLFNASWMIGSIIACAVALGTGTRDDDWAWRIPSILQIMPSLLQICTVYLLPESPRWLVSVDREDEAYAILTKYHAEGDANSVLVQAEMAQIRTTIKMEMEASSQSWMEMVATAGMRRRVFIACFMGLFTQMSGNTLLSYYSGLLFAMMGFTGQYASTRINIANQCWSLFTGVICAVLVGRFPRRLMFMTSAMSMCLCFTAMTVSFYVLRQANDAGLKNQAAQYAALIFYFAYTPCYNLGNNALTYTYLIELFPYAVRTRGIGIEQIFGKLGGFFSSNVNPIALDALDWKFLAIYCAWIFFEFSFVYFFYPETHGRTLEELAFLFEDKDKAERAVAAVQKQIHGDDHHHTIEEDDKRPISVGHTEVTR